MDDAIPKIATPWILETSSDAEDCVLMATAEVGRRIAKSQCLVSSLELMQRRSARSERMKCSSWETSLREVSGKSILFSNKFRTSVFNFDFKFSLFDSPGWIPKNYVKNVLLLR
jgi:hypothetical protein